MYQPAHLDSFLRLLISHLGSVLSEGERLLEWQSAGRRVELLLEFLETGQFSSQKTAEELHDSEALFVLQMSQSREWVDRLGQLDPEVERDADEFLAATFSIERLLLNRRERSDNYVAENLMIVSGNDNIVQNGVVDQVDIDAMLCAIFELLGRLEERYDLMEELLESKQVVNGVPFGQKFTNSKSAKIIPLFGYNKSVNQDNDPGSR